MARIQYDYTYKWVSLSDSLFPTNHFIIERVTRDVKLRTDIFNRENGHGSITGTTLASGRLFSFSGRIVGFNNATLQDGMDILNNIIKPEWLIGENELYDLTWKDFDGNEFTVKAKVYSMPQYTRDTASPVVEFTFELYAPDAVYTGVTEHTWSGGMWTIGGWIFPALLPLGGSGAVGYVDVVNAGSFQANVRIEISGTVVNPKIINLTNSRYYGLTMTTTDVVYDNTVKPIIVTDAWVSVTGNRTAWSKWVTLNPWSNRILLHGDNYNNLSVVMTIKWRDTSIHT